MQTNICTRVRVCTWFCSKANTVREAKWFILLQLLNSIHSKNKGWDSAFPTQSSESWASQLILLEAGEGTSRE